MGMLQWVQEKVSSIYQGTKTVLSTVKDVVVAVGVVLATDSFRQGFANWFIQTYQGFSRVLDPSIMVSLLTRPKTARVWMRGEATGLMRLLPAVAYQVGVRPLVGSAVRSVSDYPLVEYAAVGAVDLAAWLVMTRWMVAGAADNVACGMAMSKASSTESALREPPDSRLTRPCEHDGITQITADFNGSIYYYGNRVALYLLTNALPYGKYLCLPLQALFYGQSFLSYPLSAAGNCTEHRLETLNKNNPYALGFGGSYLAMHRALQCLIETYIPGAHGFFIDEALSSMLSLHFIMVANLSRNLPLPGTAPGTDVFYLSRALTDVAVAKTISKIEESYRDGEDSDWYQDLKKTLHAHWNHPAVRHLRFLLLDDSLQSCDKLAKRTTSRLYLELCGADIEKAIEEVIKMRSDSYYQTVDYFKNVFPTVMSEDRKKLSVVMNKYLDDPLHEWLEYMGMIRDPEFGATTQKRGLYSAARKAPSRVVLMPESTGVNASVNGFYGAARKRTHDTKSMPVLVSASTRPLPPATSPTPTPVFATSEINH